MSNRHGFRWGSHHVVCVTLVPSANISIMIISSLVLINVITYLIFSPPSSSYDDILNRVLVSCADEHVDHVCLASLLGGRPGYLVSLFPPALPLLPI